MLLFFSLSFYSKPYSFSRLFYFVCVIFKGIRRKDSISTRCTDFACMGGAALNISLSGLFCRRFQENELVIFLLFYLYSAIIHLDSNKTYIYIYMFLQFNNKVVQITANLLMSPMKEIALHLKNADIGSNCT